MGLFAKSLMLAGRCPFMSLWVMENCPAIVNQLHVLSIFFS